MDKGLLKEFVVRIVDTRDFTTPGENIKVRTTDPKSAANLAYDAYEDITGVDIGEPTLIRKEKFIDIFMTEQGYFLEVFSCQ